MHNKKKQHSNSDSSSRAVAGIMTLFTNRQYKGTCFKGKMSKKTTCLLGEMTLVSYK